MGFEYGTYDPTKEIEKPFTDGSYVEPTGEQEVRKELSFPFDELRTFINEHLYEGDTFLLDDLLLTDGNIQITKEGKKYKLTLAVSPEGVTKAYVDYNDGLTLQSAKDYTESYVATHQYELPNATKDTLGGVKVGDGLNANEGVLSTDLLLDIESIEMGNGEITTIKLNEVIETAEPSEAGKFELSFEGKNLTITAQVNGDYSIIINGTKSIGLSIKTILL